NARTTMSYPNSGGKSRAQNIHDFIVYSKQQLRDYQVPVTADVFGLVTHLEDDVGIGQNWEQVITAADVVLPMTYPSHYYTGLYGFQRPGANPYEILRLALEDAVVRTQWMADSAGAQVGEVMPWLEAMSIRGLSYGPAELREQIEATYDAGLKSWALWNPGSKFDVFLPALRPESGGPSALERGGWKKPQWEVPRNRLSRLILKRDARIAAEKKAAADSAARATTDTTRQ
ncbi:MAG TPA: putative glycoside hydrolase, partial [Gemmatimonadaceae bacterium]|nr:putative glycoside hydrolase [Gemmatimonadaceae bacterium]